MQIEDIDNLIKLHGKSIYNFCMYLTRNKQDAEDLYQETFLSVLEKMHKIKEDGNPKSYILKLSVLLWKSRQKKLRRRQSIAPAMDFEEVYTLCFEYDLEKEVVSKEQCMQVRQIVDEMEEKYKLPVYLYYTAELPVGEIAKIMGVPSGTIKSRLHKSRQLIKKRMEETGYEEYSIS